MKYVDTFCGMGGFSAAIHQVVSDAELVFAIEKDAKACETFYQNFKYNPRGDITKIDLGNVPNHDILFGGFPCQPFSRSGKWYNKNNKTIENDERSNLFLYLVKLLDLKKPKYFLFENVKELTKIRQKDGTLYLDNIVSQLEAVGYNTYHKVINSKYFNVPQSRDRVYFVGIRKDLNQSFSFPISQDINKNIEDILEYSDNFKYSWDHKRKNYKILLNETKNGKKSLKNHNFEKGHSRNEVMYHLLKNSKNNITTRSKNIELLCSLFGDTPSGQTRQQDRVYSTKGISPTITAMLVPSIYDGKYIRELSPKEASRLQGFPDSFYLHNNEKAAYKQIGNAITVTVVAAILKQLFKS